MASTIPHHSRIAETTTTSGTGTLTLAGAKSGFFGFDDEYDTSDKVYYCIEVGSDFEEGIGTFTSGGSDTLSRDTVLRSSNAGSKVSLPGTEATVFCTMPGSRGTNIMSDIDGDTKIQLEETADEDIIRFDVGGSQSVVIDANGIVTMPLQPAFLAIPSVAQNNIAIDTNVTVLFGSEVFDQNSDFAASTFTAPVTGRYLLTVRLYMQAAIDTAPNYLLCHIRTSNRDHTFIQDHGGFSSDPNYWSFAHSVVADMDAADTAIIVIYQQSGANQVDISVNSTFSGCLLA